MIAILLNLLHNQLTGAIVPLHTRFFCQSLAYIFQDGICKIGIHTLGGILYHGCFQTALGTVKDFLIFGQIAFNCSAVVTGFIVTADKAVFRSHAVFQNNLLGNSILIFFLINPPVVTHGPENVFLALHVVIEILIGVIIGGRVGNADQTGALSRCQQLQFFAEIGFRCTAHTPAALAQIDTIQIHFHNCILVILLFQLYRFEDLQNLSLHGNIVRRFILSKQ